MISNYQIYQNIKNWNNFDIKNYTCGVLIAGGKAGSYYSVINDAAVTRVVAPEPVQGY